MKNLKLLTLLSTFVLLTGLTGCGNQESYPINDIEDNYRTMYEIFPISYADSDGDTYGDLKGITEKLDFISDMNYTGLWLTPVHPSPSYHKYDVKDYKDIDPKFGTLDDYDDLVKGCHDRDMTIILDLVLNHSSDEHEWFKQAINARKKNQQSNKYYNYYNFQTITAGATVSQGWYLVPGSSTLIYEGRFTSDMPDLNLQEVLDNPNGGLATDIKDILKFWLEDHDIDGFRLDAVTSYFTGAPSQNNEFLTWLNTEIKAIKSDAYVVGEASWDSNSIENQTYQESGIDSFFMFGNANVRGYVGSTVVQQNATNIYEGVKNDITIAAEGIPAPFVCNHDTGRLVGAVAGKGSLTNAKFGSALLQILPGATFAYYGDEIGMAVSAAGINNDPNKRLHMYWGNDYDCRDPMGTISYSETECYPYGSVAKQLKDKNSLLNFVKKANLLRRQFPQLARGDVELVYKNDFDTLVVMKRTYNNESIYVAVNANVTAKVKFDKASVSDSELKVVASLCPTGSVSSNSKSITVPGQSIVILK